MHTHILRWSESRFEFEAGLPSDIKDLVQALQSLPAMDKRPG